MPSLRATVAAVLALLAGCANLNGLPRFGSNSTEPGATRAPAIVPNTAPAGRTPAIERAAPRPGSEAPAPEVPAPGPIAASSDVVSPATPQARIAAPDADAASKSIAEPVLLALAALGTNYRRGGSSALTGFDCSGFVAYVYRESWGLTLPRDSYGQAKIGQRVERDALLPGDLVFFNTLKRTNSHVGIYLGEGKFIHAPRTGYQVRIESMTMPYWTRRFDGARRVEPGRTG